MALMKCPECTREISTTASSCPHCGYIMKQSEANEFKKKISHLSVPTLAPEDKKKATGELVGGIGCLIIGIPLVTIFIGVIFILAGLWCFVQYFKYKRLSQIGSCPYCNTELKVYVGNKSFICPICHNAGEQTDATLESTH